MRRGGGGSLWSVVCGNPHRRVIQGEGDLVGASFASFADGNSIVIILCSEVIILWDNTNTVSGVILP